MKRACTWSCTHIGLVCLSAPSSSVVVGRRRSSMGAEEQPRGCVHGREGRRGGPDYSILVPWLGAFGTTVPTIILVFSSTNCTPSLELQS